MSFPTFDEWWVSGDRFYGLGDRKDVAREAWDARQAEVDRLAAEVAGLRKLAERCYPGLAESGTCSRHFGGGHFDCGCCYPDLPALIRAHVKVFDGLYRQVLEAAGVTDPPNGRYGSDPAMALVRERLAEVDRLAERVAELEGALRAIIDRCECCKGAGRVGKYEYDSASDELELTMFEPCPSANCRLAAHVLTPAAEGGGR